MAAVMILLRIVAINKYCYSNKIIRLPQQINDHFDINDKV